MLAVEKIEISGGGWIRCRSEFYTVYDIMTERDVYCFTPGINVLRGECDSGIWGISYLLSMYQYEQRSKSNAVHSPLIADVNGKTVPLKELWDKSCYMAERKNPFFSTRKTVEKQVQEAIKKNHLSESAEDIRNLFRISLERFNRPIYSTGHECFRMMAAIGYCKGKEIFCFPWMSKSRFDAFLGHLVDALRILESLNKIVILPVGHDTDIDAFWKTGCGQGCLQEYWSKYDWAKKVLDYNQFSKFDSE